MKFFKRFIMMGFLAIATIAHGMELDIDFKTKDVAEYETPEGKKMLEEYVQKSGEYELFKAVQKIFDIVDESSKELKKKDISVSRKILAEPNPSFRQTKKGLFLNLSPYPESLTTPWGELDLFEIADGSYFRRILVTQQFLKSIKVFLACIKREGLMMDQAHAKWYHICASINPAELRKFQDSTDEEWEQYKNQILKSISPEKAESLYGSDAQVVSNLCGNYSVYAMHQINEYTLPDPEMLEYQEWRSNKLCDRLWKIMNDLYQRELSNK